MTFEKLKFNSFSIYRIQQWYQSTVISLLWLRKSAFLLQSNQSTINSLLWHHKFQQRLWQWARSSFDSNRTFNEEEATAHDLLTYRTFRDGISIKTVAIFAWKRGCLGISELKKWRSRLSQDAWIAEFLTNTKSEWEKCKYTQNILLDGCYLTFWGISARK